MVAPIDAETDNDPEAGLLSWAAGRTAVGLPIGREKGRSTERPDSSARRRNCEYGAEGFVVLCPAVHMLVHERRTSAGQVSMRASALSPSFMAMTNSVRLQSAMSRTPVCPGVQRGHSGLAGEHCPGSAVHQRVWALTRCTLL